MSRLRRRLDRRPSWVLLIELFIGVGWLRAAVEKVVSPGWWRGDVIREFVASQEGRSLPWWEPVLDGVVLEGAPVVAGLVLLGQLAAGLSLLTGRRLPIGLAIGMTMNLAFVLTGAVDPSVFYLLLQAVLALWLFENHTARAVGIRYLTFFMVAGAVVAVASAPFIRTLDPMQVVEDPASVLATYAAAIAVTTFVARRRLRSGEAPLLREVGEGARSGRETVVRGDVAPPRVPAED